MTARPKLPPDATRFVAQSVTLGRLVVVSEVCEGCGTRSQGGARWKAGHRRSKWHWFSMAKTRIASQGYVPLPPMIPEWRDALNRATGGIAVWPEDGPFGRLSVPILAVESAEELGDAADESLPPELMLRLEALAKATRRAMQGEPWWSAWRAERPPSPQPEPVYDR